MKQVKYLQQIEKLLNFCWTTNWQMTKIFPVDKQFVNLTEPTNEIKISWEIYNIFIPMVECQKLLIYNKLENISD